MTTGATVSHHGYVHEAAFYGSDDDFLAVVVPFLQDGLETGEPTVVALSEKNTELVRSAMTDATHLEFVPDQYSRPASVIKSYRKILARYVAAGAQQIRIVGEVPHPGMGVPWECWARYEAAINHAFGEFPLWGLCPYDTRITPEHVLDDVARTHPYLATADGGHVTNDRYTDPAVFLALPRSPRPDPLETSPPLIDLVDPSPAAARCAVRDASRVTSLSAADVEDLVIATTETVTNASCHGRPPVQLRIWSSPARILVTVTDHGAGPTDPFAGLLPAPRAPSGGLGLWLTHQLCDLVTVDKREYGCTIRLIIGNTTLAT
jgi:anti-sigma regulatory factor (Ser/Thr protein kinase)